jgi:hypothetical protein
MSAFGKLRSRAAFRAFRLWLAGLPLPGVRRWSGAVATAVATAEVSIVVLLALPWTAAAGLALAAAVLAVFAAGTSLAVARGTSEPCHCFGASTTPLARRHVIRDVLLCVAMAFGASVASSARPSPALAVVSLAAGLSIALLVVFLEDLTALF